MIGDIGVDHLSPRCVVDAVTPRPRRDRGRSASGPSDPSIEPQAVSFGRGRLRSNKRNRPQRCQRRCAQRENDMQPSSRRPPFPLHTFAQGLAGTTKYPPFGGRRQSRVAGTLTRCVTTMRNPYTDRQLSALKEGRGPSLQTMLRLARALDVALDELLRACLASCVSRLSSQEAPTARPRTSAALVQSSTAPWWPPPLRSAHVGAQGGGGQ
jgi:hypothetical protein